METCDLQHQAMATHLLEEVFACSNNLPSVPLPQAPAQQQQQPQQERRPRPQQEQALRCPRCDSTNTKFCYYNNYSLLQPRYFCKGCRRYWTKGGTLRNVPVGGGCRKNKRPPSSSAKKAQDQTLAACTNAVLQSLPPPPPLTYDPSDLTLAFAVLQKPLPTTGQLGLDDRDPLMLDSSGANPIVPGFLDILRSGFLDSSSTGTFNNLYYGLCGHGNTQQVEGGAGGEQVVPPFEGVGGATAAIKHESSYKSVGGDNKLFMGLQWQVGGDGNMMVDPAGRDYWNGVGSSWPGLVHSSLI